MQTRWLCVFCCSLQELTARTSPPERYHQQREGLLWGWCVVGSLAKMAFFSCKKLTWSSFVRALNRDAFLIAQIGVLQATFRLSSIGHSEEKITSEKANLSEKPFVETRFKFDWVSFLTPNSCYL